MTDAELLAHYYPGLTPAQTDKLLALRTAVADWNDKINVVSRKDIDNLLAHHILHSLVIHRVVPFPPGTTVLDVGCGGGFPTLPLAVLMPQVEFMALDSTRKKLQVVADVADSLDLRNVSIEWIRVEEYRRQKFHYVIGRGVTALPEFYRLVRHCLLPKQPGLMPAGGIVYLTGTPTKAELPRDCRVQVWPVQDFINLPHYEGKAVVYLADIPVR